MPRSRLISYALPNGKENEKRPMLEAGSSLQKSSWWQSPRGGFKLPDLMPQRWPRSLQSRVTEACPKKLVDSETFHAVKVVNRDTCIGAVASDMVLGPRSPRLVSCAQFERGDRVTVTECQCHPHDKNESYKMGERGVVVEASERGKVCTVRLDGDYFLPLNERRVPCRDVHISILHLKKDGHRNLLQPVDRNACSHSPCRKQDVSSLRRKLEYRKADEAGTVQFNVTCSI